MKKLKRRLLTVLISVTALAIFCAFAARGRRPVPVKAVFPSLQNLYDTVRVTGTVEDRGETVIRSTVPMAIDRVLVRQGSSVAAEQVIAEGEVLALGLELPVLPNELSEKAALLGAEPEELRQEILDYLGLALPGTGERAQIVSPSDGVLVSLSVSEGGYLPKGGAAGAVSSLTDLCIRANVPQSDAAELALGIKAIIKGEETGGVLTRISPVAEISGSLTGTGEPTVKVTVTPKGALEALRPGYEAEVELYVKKTSNTLLVPYEAVFSEDGNDCVYIIEGGKAEKRSVTVGRLLPLETEIREGISLSDRVITEPGGIKEGERVIEVR